MPVDSDSCFVNLPAPAKINRFLHIIGRRSDGYHLLQSLFELVSLCDDLSFRKLENGKIERIGDLACAPGDDLCVRAARLLQREAGCRAGAVVKLHKKIPSGAGLGGGSSDAATTLIALNRLWGAGLSRSDLMDLGARLGADVPFFIGGRSAFVEGVGERLSPVDLPDELFAVIWPGVGSSTPQAFQRFDLTSHPQSLKINDLCGCLRNGRLRQDLHNDLEQVVSESIPQVSEALDYLGRLGAARMTGSGSAVFAALSDGKAAEAVLRRAPEAWQCFIVRSLHEHPLSGWLDNI